VRKQIRLGFQTLLHPGKIFGISILKRKETAGFTEQSRGEGTTEQAFTKSKLERVHRSRVFDVKAARKEGVEKESLERRRKKPGSRDVSRYLRSQLVLPFMHRVLQRPACRAIKWHTRCTKVGGFFEK
jgi:hypothetical protein